MGVLIGTLLRLLLIVCEFEYVLGYERAIRLKGL